MLLIGVSACTTADPRSAATPTVPYTSATGDGGEPRQPGHDAGTARRQETRGGATARSCCGCDVGERAALQASTYGSTHAPYLNRLAARGANLTHSYGLTHPSQPNYLALFSGSTQGVTSDTCPQRFPKTENLGHQLRTAGFSFAGYAESLPKVGFTGCGSGRYERKHNPWVDFTNLPASVNRPFSSFPRDYRKLPTVSFVSPNMCHSMHDCSVRTGDRWMKKHLDRYARWATHHHSWLASSPSTRTRAVQSTRYRRSLSATTSTPGRYAQRINHYTLLRTIEHAFGLPALGHAAEVSPLS